MRLSLSVQWRKRLIEAGVLLGFLLASSWLVRP